MTYEEPPRTPRHEEPPRTAFHLAQLLEETARLSMALSYHLPEPEREGDSRVGGWLKPAHWTALRYFQEASDSARTVGAFARHYHHAKSNASAVVATLVRHGLLSRDRDPGRDLRSPTVTVTEKGRGYLRRDPIAHLAAAIAALDPAEQRALEAILARIIPALAGRPAGPPALPATPALSPTTLRRRRADPAVPEQGDGGVLLEESAGRHAAPGRGRRRRPRTSD